MHKGKPSTLAIRDELTPLSLELLGNLRKLQTVLKIKRIWAGRGGNIYVRDNDSLKPIIIKNQNDLNRYVTQNPNSNKLSSYKLNVVSNI